MTGPGSLSLTINRHRAAVFQPNKKHHLNTWYVGLNNLSQRARPRQRSSPPPTFFFSSLHITIWISLSSSGEDLGALRYPGSSTATAHVWRSLTQTHSRVLTHTHIRTHSHSHTATYWPCYCSITQRRKGGEKKQAQQSNNQEIFIRERKMIQPWDSMLWGWSYQTVTHPQKTPVLIWTDKSYITENEMPVELRDGSCRYHLALKRTSYTSTFYFSFLDKHLWPYDISFRPVHPPLRRVELHSKIIQDPSYLCLVLIGW